MERPLREVAQDPPDVLPYSLPLELTVTDADVIAALWQRHEGAEREEFALRALRIGVLALKHAQGQIDATSVRQEGERLIQGVQQALQQHEQLLNERLTAQLKDYFDPQSGRFHERVERLIRRDGELEQVLRLNIGDGDSELCKTLRLHVGDGSRLMQLLDPDGSDGLASVVQRVVEQRLTEQRDAVLKQFSLDQKDGALCRFLSEVKVHYDGVSGDLTQKIDKVVGEFSLDKQDSALSRLVSRVEDAQKTITREFTLDEKESALSRLRGELVDLLERQAKSNQSFQAEVKVAIADLQARKAEAARSTRHGETFEEQVVSFFAGEAQKSGDLVEHTGRKAGSIARCFIGDAVWELGPESAAPGARIVIEAKESLEYTRKKMLDELETARKNRAAQIGMFVCSCRTAPADCEPLVRWGRDIIVIWDAEDSARDVYVRAAMTLAKALCVREQNHDAAEAADFAAIEKSILEIETRSRDLKQIGTWAKTIENNAKEILKKQKTLRETLDEQVEVLKTKTEALKALTGKE
jgi:hypothetical protein